MPPRGSQRRRWPRTLIRTDVPARWPAILPKRMLSATPRPRRRPNVPSSEPPMHSKGRLALAAALLALAPTVAAAQLTITGRITSDAGVGLPTAQVLIEGTTIGTATNDDGVYRLVVPTPRTGMVLLVRSIGYK